MTIAILLTTFNRKQKTLTCLANLRQQLLPADTRLEVFLTDDASHDGTADAVREQFPETRLFAGSGQLYWAGGTRFTWGKAMETSPDMYLLLNDDTMLERNAISRLLQTSAGSDSPAIIIGSTADQATGELSYGGWRITRPGFWKSERVSDLSSAADCDFGNANILLIPAAIVQRKGILADHFTHSLADYDYTLKAKKSGFRVIVAQGILGHCTDDHGPNWKSSNSTLRERIRYLKSPKGLAYHEYMRFISDHFPLSLPGAFTKLWLKTLFPFIWDRYKKPDSAVRVKSFT